jgi:multidrug efflux pump subunit AcrA (membrane-fusion protein)
VGLGTPLGRIDTPELDQQIVAARASLARARAGAGLARSTAARWNDLLTDHSVSQQEADEKNGNLAVQVATVRGAEADLGRLLAMKAYATIRAPFAGVVTARNADIGDLVGPGASSQQPMFTIADISRIRLYVSVPQNYAAAMKPGLQARLTVPDYPGRQFTARLVGTSDAINPQTGTLQVQLVADNPGQVLRAGAMRRFRSICRAAREPWQFLPARWCSAPPAPRSRPWGRIRKSALFASRWGAISAARSRSFPAFLRACGSSTTRRIRSPRAKPSMSTRAAMADRRALAALLGLTALAGCSMAPPYQPPAVSVPATYAEAGSWTPAAPGDAAPSQTWWTAFGDGTLDALETRLATDNPSLAVAVGRYDLARAYLAEVRAGLFPQIGAQATVTQNRQSDNRPLRGRSSQTSMPPIRWARR